jgi:hypothetical protein
VNGATLLDALDSLVRKHVVLDAHAAVAVALWTVLTYLSSAVSILPMLLITSPTKRSGKTTLVTVLGAVAYRALSVSNITVAALYRTIEQFRPTLLLDELDTFLTEDRKELTGIINSGHTRGTAQIVRCVGDDHDIKIFSTWCPKVLSGINKPLDTVVDRSVQVALARKPVGVQIARIRQDQLKDACASLRQQARRWANDHADLMTAAEPATPAALNDRAADNWRALTAIADLAGGDWPARARAAAVALSHSDGDDEPRNVQLLADIRIIFDERGVECLRSKDLLDCLLKLEDRPWSAYNRNNQPISGHAVAHLLKGFRVRPTAYKEHGRTVKGYRREDFAAAWSRYLPEDPVPIGNSVTASENIDENRRDIGNRPAAGLPIQTHENV